MKAILVLTSILLSLSAFAAGRDFTNEEMLTAVLTSPLLAQTKSTKQMTAGLDKVAVVRKKSKALIYLSYADGQGAKCGVKALVEDKRSELVITELDGLCEPLAQ